MSFDLSGLSPYTDQLSTDLISKALLKPHTVQYLTIMAGKTAGTSAINLLNSNPYIVDATCGFNTNTTGPGGATGNSTVFDQIDLVVQSKMLKEQLCAEDLRTYWLSSQLSPSAYAESVPFEAAIAQNKVDNISQYVENTIWQGDGSNLDGLLAQATVTNGCIGGTGAGITVPLVVASAFDTIWAIINKLSNALKQERDLVMYMSLTNYQIAVQAVMAEGNSLVLQFPQVNNTTGDAPMAFIFPGTNVTIFGAPGLNSNSSIILGPKKFIFFGTGLLDDADRFKFYYDPSQDVVNFMSKFRLGTAVYASQFVSTIA
jgi:archaellin